MQRNFRFLTSAIFAALLSATAACDQHPKPIPLEYRLTSPYLQVHTWAIAPAVNLSGSQNFDPLAVSDELFMELQQVQSLNVLPLNKTLAAMQQLGITNIDSAQTAQRLARVMKADAIVISAVTAFDPYRPPTVGMTMQLYTANEDAGTGPATQQETRNEDHAAGETVLQANVSSGVPGPAAGAPAEIVKAPEEPVAQVSAVFNATNQTVLTELKAFAAGRSDYDSALQEDRYLADSDAYMRFVCHAMARRLLEVERQRSGGR